MLTNVHPQKCSQLASVLEMDLLITGRNSHGMLAGLWRGYVCVRVCVGGIITIPPHTHTHTKLCEMILVCIFYLQASMVLTPTQNTGDGPQMFAGRNNPNKLVGQVTVQAIFCWETLSPIIHGQGSLLYITYCYTRYIPTRQQPYIVAMAF